VPAAKGLTFMAAEAVDETAGDVSDLANLTTLSTGGLSAPVTVPLAKAADGASTLAKVTKGSIHMSEGNTDAAISEFSEAGVNAALGHAGGKVVKGLKKSKAINSKSSETILSNTADVWVSVIMKILF